MLNTKFIIFNQKYIHYGKFIDDFRHLIEA